MTENFLANVIRDIGGRKKVAELCKVSYQAVRKWELKGRFPRTDYTGESKYAEILALNSQGKYTKNDLHKKTASSH